VGGHDEEGGIYVFALDTMEIVFRKGALADRINQIEFSPDGRYLAVGLITREVLIMDSRDWSLVAVLEFGTVRVGGLSFAGDGRLAVTCQDGRVRIYSGDLTAIASIAFPVIPNPLWPGSVQTVANWW
jgi:WD40 repeat protein